jgi:hypothetical protein
MKLLPIPGRRHSLATRSSLFLVILALTAGMSGFHVIAADDILPSQNLEIRTWYDLNAIRDNTSGDHKLMNDLDSTTSGYAELASPTANGGKGWEPIGYIEGACSVCGGCYAVGYSFKGTFDGQEYVIRDLYSELGLFGLLGSGGMIKNIGLANVTVVGSNVIGSLAGTNQGGTVDSCYAAGNVTGDAAVGGLVGRLVSGTISNSYSTGSVIGESSTGIGGLVGQQHSDGIISNCYSACSVAGGSEFGSGEIGGLVGSNTGGPVTWSFWDTETSGQSTSAGGIGKNTTEMQDIGTFVGWNIVAVSLNQTNPAYIWNIVNNVTYPFLGCQSPPLT